MREIIAQSGSSQGEFAARIGLDNSKLSKSLSGVRRFSSPDRARIAASSRVSVDWLLTGQDTPLALAARAEAGSSSEQAVGEANRLSSARSDIAFLGYPEPWQPMKLLALQGRLIDQGGTLATYAERRFAEHGLGPTNSDLACAIETAFGVDVTVGDLGPRFDRLCVSSDEVKLILANQSALPWRQRFTIAHELAHMLVGDDQELHLDQDVIAANRRRDHSELRANAFTAALLMPERSLRAAVGRQGLDPESFARLALPLTGEPKRACLPLAELPADRRRRKRAVSAGECEERGRHGGCRREFAAKVAVAARRRPPGLLARDTYAAYGAGTATLRPDANVLGVEAEELRRQLEAGTEQEPHTT